MLIGMALLLWSAQLLLTGFWTGAGAVHGAAAGCVQWLASAGGSSLVRRQNFERQMPTAKMQIAAPIIAAGDVKAQCRSRFLGWTTWSSWSRRMVASNSPLYLVLERPGGLPLCSHGEHQYIRSLWFLRPSPWPWSWPRWTWIRRRRWRDPCCTCSFWAWS